MTDGRRCELDKIVAARGRPGGIVSNNGTELTSTAILAWLDRQRVAWHYTSSRDFWQMIRFEDSGTGGAQFPQGVGEAGCGRLP
jgi:hypothetical protein